jgi:hypothetical protein
MTHPVSPSGSPHREPQAAPRKPWLRRHHFVASLGAVAILAGAAGAAATTWQLNRADQRQQQIARAQARLTSAVYQLDQNAVTLSANRFLNQDLAVMQKHLASEMSAWAAERNARCPEESSRSRIIGDTAVVVSELMWLQADVKHLHGALARVQRNLSAVEREVKAIRSLGGQVQHDPSSAIYLGNKALSDTRHTAQAEFRAGASLAAHATKIARMASIYARKASC